MQKIAADQGLDGENNLIVSTGWHNGLVRSSNIFFCDDTSPTYGHTNTLISPCQLASFTKPSSVFGSMC